ncbi:putative disease resistance RPP13-like protein 1 isoform X2 [Medicago truncatula]|uniref:putative disease resistance RPP13-like protein 1 isoform X2 n=1 Tax=Medicago truncatula TaxID=3880 RepID=UPI001966E0C5|nr:putative disease resistance RPP13-like protein 1 isoform X2 [Medicago truncatula]
MAFLSPIIQEICERLSSTDFGGYVREELGKKLEITLVSINQVLDDAETKKYENQNVKNWVDDASNEVYELDQLLDIIASDSANQKGKIQRFLSGSINRFESRIKVLLKRLVGFAEQTERLGLHEGGASRFSAASLGHEYVIYGREHEQEEMIDFLLSDSHGENQLPIISIVGLTGIGKTALAQLVYNDHRIQEQFEFKAWVHVSETFNYDHLIKSILRSISSAEVGDEGTEILNSQLQQQLAGKKYLLVLDDVGIKNGNMLEHLLLPLNRGSSRGKMIVTTHDSEVALVMRSTRLLHLKQLEESDSWSLFVRYAFQGKNVFEYPNLELIGKKIVAKCGGLPLTLKTLGILFQRKFSVTEWVEILETDLWCLPEGDNCINFALRMHYLSLPPNLKRCFACWSNLPKGYEFEEGELIRLWMAEGLLNCCGRNKSKEELGNEFFDQLVSMSFFQQSVLMPLWTGKCYFIMHDLVNDLAKSVSGEFRLRIRIEGDNMKDIPKRTRHVWCCLDLEDGDRKLENVKKIKGLHSLMVEAQGYGDQRFKVRTDVQLNLFLRLKYLRMLSFSGCNLLELADEIRNLKLLRYLDLSYTEITSLPNSICKLYSLHTLLLEECFKLTELPSNFCKLVNLRHLNLKGTHIKKMPKEMRGLINLEMLTDFVVGEQHGFDIKQLAELNHLKGRLQISGLKNVADPADAMAANLKHKKHLEELSLSYDEWREMDGSVTEACFSVLEALRPNRNLTRLSINDYRGSSFPNWLGDHHHLANLLSLELLGCTHCSQLPPLGQFPSLKKLSISGCHGVEIIGSEFCRYNSANVPFRSLETLCFKNMSEWKEWLCLDGFPLVKELSLNHCPKLKSTLPYHLPSLLKLEIIDCQELEASIPNAANISDIELKRCDGIFINKLPSSLERAILCGTHVIETTLEKILVSSAFLEELEVEDFFGPNLEWSSLNMCSCNSLRTLTITGAAKRRREVGSPAG